jgi:hypothetical protein
VSRFSGGLIVDIGPPEYETRVAIIRRKSEELDTKLAAGVAETLARFPARNVRELGGILNKVLAVQDLEGREMTPEEVAQLIGPVSTPAVVAAAPAAAPTTQDDFASFMSELSESVASTVEAQEDPWRKAFRQAIEAAEREGFSAARLRMLLEDGQDEGWQQVLETNQGILARLREIEKELDRLGNPWPEAAQGVLRDPERLEEAESLLESVRERMRPFLAIGPGPRLPELKDFPPITVRAAEQLIGADKPKYNPVYLWSRDAGAGRAVLAATGRSFQRDDARMAVTSVSEFAEDFIRALSAGVAGAWRERWWTVDLLLVHGIEALSGTERAQDEFFHLFEALKRRGSRVLLAADRPPSEIAGIDERLRSRFEGGLVLEVDTKGVPVSLGTITLVPPRGAAPARPSAEDIWAGTAKGAAAESAVSAAALPTASPAPKIPPLDDLKGERGGLVLQKEEPARATAADPGVWIPSHEKVVWNWPVLEDRLVEDFE